MPAPRLSKTLRTAAALALIAAGAPLAAQALASLTTPAQRQAAALNLPEITVFGTVEPNVRKATAIVNGEIVTDTDVEHRLALVLIANGGRASPEEVQILRLQVLRNLIDERLQVQEARQRDVVISEQEVAQAYQRVATNFQGEGQDFDTLLREGGSSPETIKQQIRAELAWSRLLRKRIEPFVNVGDEEVQLIIQRLESAKGAEEFRVGEIFLSAPPELMAQTLSDAARIVQQVREGASFVAYARQFSEASTAAVGGDLGWVRAEQLSPSLRPVITALQRGQVSDPVPVPGGVTILALIEKRQVLAADPADAILSLLQMTVPVPDSMTEPQARQLAARIQDRTRNMGGCGRAPDVARELGAELVSNDQIRLGDLPEQLQQIMGQLPIGGSTPPFGSQQDGLRVLVLCGRDDAPVNANLPSFDQVYAQLSDQRVNSAARRYLRDLRRDAVIDYR
jgi:peptidyl-prolyl cis-trans isomerase SurA